MTFMPQFMQGGATIAFDDAGSGPAIVFVHGHPFNRTMWDAQRGPVTAAGWRMVNADLRGYGQSSIIAGKTPLDLFVDDVAAGLDHLGIEKAVIAGLSMGGQITMGFAQKYPQRVIGLVLAATFPQAETPEGRIKRYETADRIEHGAEKAYQTYVDELLPGMMAVDTFRNQPDVAAFVEGMMRNTDPRGAAAALRGRAERQEFVTTLANFNKPALIVIGDQDSFTTVTDGEAMHRLMPHAKLLIVPGVGHMPNLEARELFNEELVAFLDRLKADPFSRRPARS
jgi:3-oxoadipate enol-lactonase